MPGLRPDGLAAILAAITNLKYRVLLMTMYAAGLRISEACRLRIEDIDSKRMVLRVRDGKGGKDRYTLVPQRLLEVLRQYWQIDQPRGWLFPSRTREGHANPSSVRIAFKLALGQTERSKRMSRRALGVWVALLVVLVALVCLSRFSGS